MVWNEDSKENSQCSFRQNCTVLELLQWDYLNIYVFCGLPSFICTKWYRNDNWSRVANMKMAVTGAWWPI
jgi:hypothetical protein